MSDEAVSCSVVTHRAVQVQHDISHCMVEVVQSAGLERHNPGWEHGLQNFRGITEGLVWFSRPNCQTSC